MRRTLALVVIGALVLAICIADRAVVLDGEHADAVAQLRAVQASATDVAQREEHLRALIAASEKDRADRAAVLAVRPAFVAEVAAFSAALNSAQGKIDTSADRASALSAQQAVLAERVDPAVVTNATATVHALTAKIAGDVAAWQAAQRPLPSRQASAAPSTSSSGSKGYEKVRAALDRVGGAGIGLYESESCAGGTAAACANSDGYIKYRADIAGWSTDRLNWAMAHELAHIYQFRVWGALTSSSSYSSMFDSDAEFLANCMAEVRGFPGTVDCSTEQQTWASGIWVGAVR